MKNNYFNYFSSYSFKENSSIPMHDHATYELVFFIEGMGNSVTPQKTYHYKPQQCILYSPFTKHDEHHVMPTKTECLTFSMDTEFLPTVQLVENTKQLFMLKDMLINELQEKKLNYPDMIDAIIQQIVVTISRMANVSKEIPEAYSIDSAIRYIDENYHIDLDVRTIATSYAYSYDHFRHLFKAQTGVSPNHYIIDKRLNKAKRLLEETDDSIEKIAELCGCDNLSQFSYIFKKWNSITPSEYRKLNRNN